MRVVNKALVEDTHAHEILEKVFGEGLQQVVEYLPAV